MRWWLSFSNKDGPIGVVISEGDDGQQAIWNAAKQGADPGGDECMTVPLECGDGAALNSLPLYQLLTREQLRLIHAVSVPPTTVQQILDGTYKGPA